MIAIVDYNAGNIASIVNMLKKNGKTAFITSKPEDVLKAEKIILPGVGAFDHGMENLNPLGLSYSITQQAKKGNTDIRYLPGCTTYGE
jgi:glutamine amidotransferase